MIHVPKFVKIMREKTGLVVMLAVNISMPAASVTLILIINML